MATKLRLADMADDSSKTSTMKVNEGIRYLNAVPELTRHNVGDNILWVGEGCETQHWIAIYESTPKRFRVVKEVKFLISDWNSTPRIESFTGERVQSLDELAAKVEDAFFQLKKARAELAEYTRIKRKAEVRNAAREYEV